MAQAESSTEKSIRRFGLWVAFVYTILSVLISLASVALIIFYVYNANWLPAIFFLLARQQLTGFLDSEAERLGYYQKQRDQSV